MRSRTPESPENTVPGPRYTDFEELYADERWRGLGDLIPDGLIMINRAGLISYMNTAAESINEVYRQTVVGHPLEDLVQQSRVDCSVLIEVFHEDSRVNTIVSDANGRTYLLSTRSYLWRNGERSDFMIVLRNLDALEKTVLRLYEGDPGSGLLPAVVETRKRKAMLPDVPVASFVPNFTLTSGKATVAGNDDPIINGKVTTAIVEHGLRAVAMNIRLLILGESGGGKTELARLLHRRSGLASHPFVRVNCGAIPDTLFESEMFGYERGAFTGASNSGKKGQIEAAEGGILFLDEVGEIPLHCQAKILQMLEDGVIQRVGSTVSRRIQVQIIAATNRDLLALVEEGRFRRDLYYRLSVVTLVLPPLRERRELIPSLLERFLAKVNQRRDKPLMIAPGCRRRLQEYDYPGNIRELQNIIEYLSVICDHVATEANLPAEVFGQNADRIHENHLPQEVSEQNADRIREMPSDGNFPTGFNLKETVRNYESSLIDAAIQKSGSKRKAAELLGVDIATVVRKSRKKTATEAE